MSVGKRIRLCLACTSAFLVGAVPALATTPGQPRTVHLRVHQLDGTAVPDALVTLSTVNGGVTVASETGNGAYQASQIGAKTTINIAHSTLGSASVDLALPSRNLVVVDVGFGGGAARASVVNPNPDAMLSAVGAGGGVALGGSNCCFPNGTPGCDDPDCEAIVCGVDPFCCDTEWDSICADEAADLCGDLCGGGGGGCDPPLECPAGALDEGEACGSDTNGGCNSDPPIFTDAMCGDTFCGTAWADGGTRDTDWYLVTLDSAGSISATLTSAFDGVAFIVDGIDTCSPVVVGDIGCSSNCTNIQVASANLPAGTYAVFVATGDCAGGGIFEGFPCGGGNNDYVVEITCGAAQTGACCFADASCMDITEVECMQLGGTFQGNGTECANVTCPELCGPGAGDCCVEGGNGTPGCDDADCCNMICAIDPFCCDVSWDGICADEAQDMCAVCQEPGACCFQDGTCQDVAGQAECASLGGEFQGAGTDCASVDCPAVCGDPAGGDCCVEGGNGTPGCDDAECCNMICAIDPFCCDVSWDGICADEAQEMCAVCQPEPEAACCLADGTCVNATEADCAAQGGEFFPDESCTGEFVYTLDSCTNPFEDISGTGIIAPIASSTDDGGDAGIPLGFTFNFFGDDHTTVGIASNGYLTFGADLSDFTNDPIPVAMDPNDYIGPLWDDWSPNQAGDVRYQTMGPAGSQQFIAQWTNVPHFNTGGASTFQVILFEGSNCIEYRYGSPLSYVDPTIGVENQDGTVGFPGGFGPAVVSGDCLRLCPEELDAFECPSPEILAAVSIKHGACPAPFNASSNGVLPVALAGTMDIDASMVDISSLELSRADGVGGSVTPIEGPPGPHTKIKDVTSPFFPSEPCECESLGPDGVDDVEMKFSSTEVAEVLELDGLNGMMVELRLSGLLLDGTPFAGTDCVLLVPPGAAPGMMTVGSNVPGVWVNVSPLDDQLDGSGFTGFYRTFPDATPVSLSAPVVPANYPDHVLVSWTVDGVEIPVDVDPSVGKATLEILVDGYVHSVSMTYRRQGGGFGLPGGPGGGIQQGGAGVQSD